MRAIEMNKSINEYFQKFHNIYVAALCLVAQYKRVMMSIVCVWLCEKNKSQNNTAFVWNLCLLLIQVCGTDNR